MKWKTGAIIVLFILSIVILSGCIGQRPEGTPAANATPTATVSNPTKQAEQACINSGGGVSTAMCCKSVSDFPNNCLIGACGCLSNNSHQVKTCDCGAGKCFNGSTCVSRTSLEPPASGVSSIWYMARRPRAGGGYEFYHSCRVQDRSYYHLTDALGGGWYDGNYYEGSDGWTYQYDQGHDYGIWVVDGGGGMLAPPVHDIPDSSFCEEWHSGPANAGEWNYFSIEKPPDWPWKNQPPV